MADANLNMWRIVATIFLILISFNYKLKVNANSMVPCYFIFGDSLSDPGNNNGLKTKAKTNYKPYGIDYPGSRPTGRFTNGRTVVDVIAKHLGFKEEIVGYSRAKGDQILIGVNYASGAAGILPESGSHLGNRSSLEMQLKHHKKIIKKLDAMLNNGTTTDYLTKCLYTTNIGNNDYINNYFLTEVYPTSTKYNPPEFANALINEYSKHLKALYESGARKIGVFGLGLVGCALAEVALHPSSAPNCVNGINVAVNMFNTRLKVLISQLQSQLPNAQIIYINSEAIVVGPAQGITVLDKPCCTLREDFQCKENTTPCSDRDTHFFWDGFHPTSAAHKAIGDVVFKDLAPLL